MEKNSPLTARTGGTAKAPHSRRRVNNDFYDHLGRRWLEARDDPVALLRAEGRRKHEWVNRRLAERFGKSRLSILDIGCGAGFCLRSLGEKGHRVHGVDRSRASLDVAREFARGSALQVADAYRLPYGETSFDAVCALDFLEHVERPEKVVAEAARVLKPGGLFFFHTFNRNALAWLVIIKGVEWFVKNTPRDMHVLSWFIKPQELEGYCRQNGLQVEALVGLRPDVRRRAFWKMLATREVPPDFDFVLTPSTLLSYLGMAVRNTSATSPPNRGEARPPLPPG